jgi:hypothetical protein
MIEYVVLKKFHGSLQGFINRDSKTCQNDTIKVAFLKLGKRLPNPK